MGAVQEVGLVLIPSPSASDLGAATEVVVIRGAGYDVRHRRRNEVVLRERGPEAIRTIAELLYDTIPGAEPMAWMEPPEVSVVFLHERRVVHELGLLVSAEWVRDDERGDLPLARPEAVAAWLAARGVRLPLGP